MFASSVPTILAAIAISAGPPSFPAMFDDAPAPRPHGAPLSFDDDASLMDEVASEDDAAAMDEIPSDDEVSSDDELSPTAEGISASSAQARRDTRGDAGDEGDAGDTLAGEPAPSPGDALPLPRPGADRALGAPLAAGWARLLPRLILSVSATYRDRAAGRSAEMAIWLGLSWSLDARAMQGSLR